MIVKEIKPAETTESGLYLPSSAQGKSHQGLVQAVPDESELSVGDRIVFLRNSMLEMNIDGENLLAVPEKDILTVLVYA